MSKTTCTIIHHLDGNQDGEWHYHIHGRDTGICYGDFSDKEDARGYLQPGDSIVKLDYCINNTACTPELRIKFRCDDHV